MNLNEAIAEITSLKEELEKYTKMCAIIKRALELVCYHAIGQDAAKLRDFIIEQQAEIDRLKAENENLRESNKRSDEAEYQRNLACDELTGKYGDACPSDAVCFNAFPECNTCIEGDPQACWERWFKERDCSRNPNRRQAASDYKAEYERITDECPVCTSIGKLSFMMPNETKFKQCSRCNGTGRVPKNILPDDLIKRWQDRPLMLRDGMILKRTALYADLQPLLKAWLPLYIIEKTPLGYQLKRGDSDD